MGRRMPTGLRRPEPIKVNTGEARIAMTQQFRPIQALMRMGFALALGTLMLGTIGVLLAWLGPAGSASLPLLLLAPGIAMLIVAAVFTAYSLRENPEDWRDSYRSCARIASAVAIIAGVLTIGVAVALAVSGPLFQVILVALIALEGPAALWFASRRLRSIASR